jgi:Protein of unknown function (DUF4232)
MTPRTLTEELQSVLREQALGAPQPDATVDFVLEQVGGGAESVPPPPSRFASLSGLPRRLRPPPILLAAVVVIVFLAFGVVGLVNLNRTSNGSDSSSSGASVATGAEGEAATAPQQTSGNLSQRGQTGKLSNGQPDAGNGNAAGSQAAPAPSAAGSEVAPAVPTVCAQNEYRSTVELTLGATKRWVVLGHCLTPAGVPNGGYVDVYAADSNEHVLHVLPLADHMYPDTAIEVDGGRLLIRAAKIDNRPSAAPGAPLAGTAFDFVVSFTATGSHLESKTEVALPCTARDVAVSAVDSGTPVPHRVIRIVNTTPSPCTLLGAPEVTLAGISGKTTVVAQTLRGPAGGSTSGVVPLIVMAPDAVASAILEPAAGAFGCTGPDTIIVTLHGVGLGVASSNLGTCGATVHPFFGGNDGNG